MVDLLGTVPFPPWHCVFSLPSTSIPDSCLLPFKWNMPPFSSCFPSNSFCFSQTFSSTYNTYYLPACHTCSQRSYYPNLPVPQTPTVFFHSITLRCLVLICLLPCLLGFCFCSTLFCLAFAFEHALTFWFLVFVAVFFPLQLLCFAWVWFLSLPALCIGIAVTCLCLPVW